MDFWKNVEEVVKKKQQTPNFGQYNLYNTKAETDEPERKEIKEDNQELQKKTEEAADVVLVTAVEDEYIAVKKIFKNIDTERFENGYKYSLANCEIQEGQNIVIAIFRQNNMGLVSASMTATSAVNRFNPGLLLMCGVCAGVENKANLGDLIIFSPVYDYGSGKYNAGNFLSDYRQRQIGGLVRPIVEEMSCDRNLKREIKDAWENQMGKPDTELSIYIYPGGSGAAVITDEAVVEELKKHQRTLGAIDMESYAIAEVASTAMAKEIPWMVVKGVQDFATPLKDDRYREYAAYASGMFVKKFLEKYYAKNKSEK